MAMLSHRSCWRLSPFDWSDFCAKAAVRSMILHSPHPRLGRTTSDQYLQSGIGETLQGANTAQVRTPGMLVDVCSTNSLPLTEQPAPWLRTGPSTHTRMPFAPPGRRLADKAIMAWNAGEIDRDELALAVPASQSDGLLQ